MGLPSTVSQSIKEGMKPESLNKLSTIDEVYKDGRNLVQGLLANNKIATGDNTKGLKTFIASTIKDKPQGQSRG